APRARPGHRDQRRRNRSRRRHQRVRGHLGDAGAADGRAARADGPGHRRRGALARLHRRWAPCRRHAHDRAGRRGAGMRVLPGPASLVACAALALVATLLLALGLSGAADPLVLGDPGPGVRWGLPAAAALGRLAAALAVGALVLCAVVLPPGPGWERA